VLENAVVLKVSMTGASPTPTPGTITVDVAGQAATADATPNVPLPTLVSLDPVGGTPCVLSSTQTTCSKFFLPKGALDAVYLYQTRCDTPSTCKTAGGSTAQVVNAVGSLVDNGGTPLYSAAHPAALQIDCWKTLCPHPDYDPPGSPYTLHELQEDVAANPVLFTVFLPGSKTTELTAVAKICAKAGIVDAGKYFCIDPVKSVRDSKGYHPYVLFFGDPKGRIT
jgi:hypothetical protein